jgi:transcriptional regulator with XRE-family HTH domain
MEINGDALRDARERAFLTQQELADKAGMTASTVNRLENELQLARISSVRKLAMALGLHPGDLIRQGKAVA